MLPRPPPFLKAVSNMFEATFKHHSNPQKRIKELEQEVRNYQEVITNLQLQRSNEDLAAAVLGAGEQAPSSGCPGPGQDSGPKCLGFGTW